MDLHIIAVWMKFEGSPVVIFLPSRQAPPAVSPDFVRRRRVNATWLPNRLTLTSMSVKLMLRRENIDVRFYLLEH